MNEGEDQTADECFERWWESFRTTYNVTKEPAREIYKAGFSAGVDEGKYQ